MWKKPFLSVPKPAVLPRLGLGGAKKCQGTLQVASRPQEDEKQRETRSSPLNPVLRRALVEHGAVASLLPAHGLDKKDNNALLKIRETVDKDKDKSSAKDSRSDLLYSLYYKIATISAALKWRKCLHDGDSPRAPRKQGFLLDLMTVYRALWTGARSTNSLSILPLSITPNDEKHAAQPSSKPDNKDDLDIACSSADSACSSSHSACSSPDSACSSLDSACSSFGSACSSLNSACSSLDSVFANCASWTQNTLGVKFATLKQHKKAVDLFEKACNSGLASAQFNLGLCYEKGQGVPCDLNRAAEYYSKAANQKHAGAIYNLAGFYFLGVGGLLKSQDMSVALMEEAAQLGLAQAQTYLGLHYADSASGERNLAKSYEYFLKAASQKDKEAQFYLGICYEKGLGIARDLEEAFRWYSVAAQAGHISATYNVGVFHEHGLGGLSVNKEKAMECYRIAAEAGDVDAKHNLQLLERSMQDETEVARNIFITLLSNWNFPEVMGESKPQVQITRNSSSPCLGVNK